MLCGLVHYRADLLLVRHITGDSQNLGAALRQVLPSARQFLRITGGQDQPTSRPHKLACQCQTESPCTPSNQDRVPEGANSVPEPRVLCLGPV